MALLPVVLPEADPTLGSTSSHRVNGDPKRTYAKGHLPGLLFPGPHDKPLLNHTSTEDPPIRVGLVQSYGVTALFP